MNPSTTPTNPLVDPWGDQQRPPVRTARVFNTVKVDPANFASALFMGAQPRKEFVKERGVSNADKPQKYTSDGVPLWSVKLAGTNWRDQSEMLSVTVPMNSDPSEKFHQGQPVELPGLVFGVTAKRDGGHSLWWSADDITAVGRQLIKD